MNERLKRLILGNPESIAGTVYGTIIVMSVIAAGAKAYEHHLWRLVVLAGGSAVVLWLGDVYSHAIGESLTIGRRITMDEMALVSRRKFAVIAAAIIPLVAVALGATGVGSAGALARGGRAGGSGRSVRALREPASECDFSHDWCQPRHRLGARRTRGSGRPLARIVQ
jgi:hypothetical protein